MMRFVPVLVLAASSFLARRLCCGFSSNLGIRATSKNRFASTSLHSNLLPTEESVKNDEFMQQLGHASQIIPLLHPEEGDEVSPENEENLKSVLAQQLSHSDGVRGFMAVYLTSPESLKVEKVPEILAETVRQADAKIMAPLACMNVIMPTAMSSIHQDPELRECASKTANNGLKILRLVKDDEIVTNHCSAIRDVCNNNNGTQGDAELIEYWTKFFSNYKYQEEQRKDIAAAIDEFIR